MVSLSGQQFGRLTALMPSDKGEHFVMARCECGGLWEGYKYSLLNGHTRSCGCEWHQAKHGQSGTAEYGIWRDIKQRCLNPRSMKYADYGGRGIAMHVPWQESFEAFVADVGPRPAGTRGLDRIDNDGPYAPGNVRWTTSAQQSRNTRRNHWLEFRGERLTLTDIAERYQVNTGTLRKRLRNGWELERALTTVAV